MATSYPFRPIVHSGLILSLDAENTKSYSGSGLDWYDLTSNNNNGVLTNSPTFEFNGVASFIFDGVNDYVEFGDILDLGTNSLTINLWLNLNSKTIGDIFLSKAFDNVGDYRYAVGIDYYGSGGLNAFMIGNTGIATDVYPVGTTDVPLNTWFMCTFVFDRNSDIKIYYNGVLETLTFPQGGDATISQWIGQDFQSNNPFRIGCYTAGDNITPNYFMNGKMSISQIYNRALTPKEVLQNYNALKHRFDIPIPTIIPIITTGLILNLDAGDPTSYPGSGTNWNDLGIYNNDATLVNGVSYSSIDGGGSMIFDGVNDYGTVSYNSNFDLSNTDYTLEGWFNSNSFSTLQSLISKDTYGQNFDWSLLIGSIGNVSNSTTLTFYSNGTTTNVTATVPTMSAGQWYHYVVTSISGVIRIYLNSILYKTQSMSTSNSSQVYVTLGRYSWNGPTDSPPGIPGGYINGKISILRVYRIGLTGTEVLQNYNAIKNRY
jgi:hypothetical protein